MEIYAEMEASKRDFGETKSYSFGTEGRFKLLYILAFTRR